MYKQKELYNTMNPIQEKAQWASQVWKKILETGLLQVDDTAIIFYSIKSLNERLAHIKRLFDADPSKTTHTVAVKTNPHPAVLREIVQAGFGLETASLEEVKLAVQAGAPFETITYNSPVKTPRDIAFCEENYPGLRLNANSLAELKRMSADSPLHIGLRINPMVNPGSNDLYNVSGAESKFGVPINQREAIIEAVLKHGVDTLHVHVGSQVGHLDIVVDAHVAAQNLADEINARSLNEKGKTAIKSLNIGGGIPAGTDACSSLETMKDYTSRIHQRLATLGHAEGYHLITEFGQWVHKHNGITFSQVEYVTKLPADKYVAYVHVGADLFMRESYTSVNPLEFIVLDARGEQVHRTKAMFDIAGPLCFNGDYLGKNRELPMMEVGDIMAIPSSAANSYGLWSRHCSRSIPSIFMDDAEGEQIVKVSERQDFY